MQYFDTKTVNIGMKQCTIGEDVSIDGIGLHTGQNVSMVFKPAPTGHGYKFQRTDLVGAPIIAADVTINADLEIVWHKMLDLETYKILTFS